MPQKDPKRTPSSSNHPFPGALAVSFMEGYVFSAQGFPRAHCCQAAHGGRWAAAVRALLIWQSLSACVFSRNLSIFWQVQAPYCFQQ